MSRESFENLVDVEGQIDDLQSVNCTYDCECYDNGEECRSDCPILAILTKLREKADKIIK